MSFRFTLFLQISLQKIRSHSHERSLFLNKKFVSIRKWKTKRKSTREMGSGQCPLDTKRFVIRGINDGEQEPTKNSQEMAKNRDKWKSLKVACLQYWEIKGLTTMAVSAVRRFSIFKIVQRSSLGSVSCWIIRSIVKPSLLHPEYPLPEHRTKLY